MCKCENVLPTRVRVAAALAKADANEIQLLHFICIFANFHIC